MNKIICFVCMLSFLFQLSGCVRQGNPSVQDNAENEVFAYQKQAVDLGSDCRLAWGSFLADPFNGTICLYGDSIYSVGICGEDGTFTIVKMNPSDGILTDQKVELSSLPQGMMVNETHYILFEMDYPYYTLRITDREGNEQAIVSVNALLNGFDPNRKIPYAAADEEFIYVAANQQMAVLDMQGNKVTEYALAGQVMQLQTDRTGRLYVLERVNGSVALEFLDSPAGKLTLAEEHNDKVKMINPRNMVCGEENLLYFINANGLIRYRMDSGKYREIINWNKENFLAESANSVVAVSDELIYLTGSSDQYSGGNFYRFTRMTEEEMAQISEEEKIEIKITYSEDGTNDIQQAALKFNAAQNVYRAVCEAIPYPSGEELLNDYDRKLLTGELGDVVIMSSNLNYADYAAKGAFVNLYDLMEQDSGYAAEDIFPCVREALESRDGGLYVITQEFSPRILVGKEENLPDGLWNLDAMLSLAKSMPEGTKLMTGMNRETALRCLLSAGADAFIDDERAECSFESETFLHLMEYLKSLPESVEWVGLQQNNAPYLNDEILLCETSISCFIEYHILRAGFGFDSELQIVGYPSAAGGVADIIPHHLLGISASSEQQAGAWKFVKFMLSGEAIYDEMKGMNWIPAMKDTLQGWRKNEGQLYYYFAEGTTDYRTSLGPFQDESKIDYPGRLVTLDDETLAKFTAFVESIHAAPGLPEDIYTIIQEEMSGYFAGAKSAAETAKVIQNRVGTYLSEQS